jgi:hypothetical protein
VDLIQVNEEQIDGCNPMKASLEEEDCMRQNAWHKGMIFPILEPRQRMRSRVLLKDKAEDMRATQQLVGNTRPDSLESSNAAVIGSLV